MHCSGAKNLRLLRDQGKIRVLKEDLSQSKNRWSNRLLLKETDKSAFSKRPGVAAQSVKGRMNSSKTAEYMRNFAEVNRAEMLEIEKVIISKEDERAMRE